MCAAETSLTRTSLPHPHDAGATLQHVEIAFDVAGGRMMPAVYRAAFGAVRTVDVSLTLVLEGRTEAELPERALATARLRGLDPSLTAPPHASWPADGAGVPPGDAMTASVADVVAAIAAAKIR